MNPRRLRSMVVAAAGPVLCEHVGGVDLMGTFEALADIGCEGPGSFQGFSRATADPAHAHLLATRRSPCTDGGARAANVIEFVRKPMAPHQR